MKFVKLASGIAAMLVIAACSSGNGNQGDVNNPLPDTANIQIVHAVADAPTVDVLVDGQPRLTDVDYKQASALITLLPGTYSVEVLANLPDGSQLSVIGPADIPLAAETTTTVAAVGSVADGIAPVVFSQASSAVPADSARVAVIHATPGPGGTLPVSVYVTDPAVEDLDGVAPIGTFDFGETLDPIDVTAGTYRIRVVPEVPGNVIEGPVYDSGPVDLDDGANLRLVAVPNVSGGPAALTLMAVSASGSADILDSRTPAFVRVGHLSPDAPPVDVILDTVVDGAASGNEFTLDPLDGLAFPGIVPTFGFVPVDPATYRVRIETDDNATIVLPGTGEDPIDVPLAAGDVFQVFAVNTLDSIELLTATDTPRPKATGAQVRVIHAASNPAAALVDVYVLPAGTGTTDGSVDEGVAPAIADFAFKANSGYVDLPADVEGTAYDVCVTVADTAGCAIFVPAIEVFPGVVATAVARDDEEGGFGAELLFDYPLVPDVL